MSQKMNLKEIERKAFTSTFQDGLWDILIGLLSVGWGLMILADFAAFGGILFAVLYMVVLGIKRLITYPRIGHVKFLNARRRLTKNMAVGLAVFIFLALITVYFLLLTREGIRPAFLTWLNNYFTEPSLLIMAVVPAIIISVFAYIYRINRWYFYALLTMTGFSVGALGQTEFSMGLPIAICGTVIVLCGLTFLIRFLRKNPKSVEEADENR